MGMLYVFLVIWLYTVKYMIDMYCTLLQFELRLSMDAAGIRKDTGS